MIFSRTVGYGGSPDVSVDCRDLRPKASRLQENGETTLDALLFDGFNMGAVADLRRVRDAARVAWAVMYVVGGWAAAIVFTLYELHGTLADRRRVGHSIRA